MVRLVIKLESSDYEKLKGVCDHIQELANKTGVKLVGPIPLPTKKLVVVTRKTPCGEGTHTWDKWELRIHKRLIQVDANERFMRRLKMMKIPDSVRIRSPKYG
jgi:small subunit ribosomal protein S10